MNRSITIEPAAQEVDRPQNNVRISESEKQGAGTPLRLYRCTSPQHQD
ncbi:hypothetical protein [Hafnia paralvei]